jgi:hypothetical protein
VRNFVPRAEHAERNFAIWAALRAAQMAKLSPRRTSKKQKVLRTLITLALQSVTKIKAIALLVRCQILSDGFILMGVQSTPIKINVTKH